MRHVENDITAVPFVAMTTSNTEGVMENETTDT